VLSNLINNSIESFDENSHYVYITVEKLTDLIQITLQDDGKGIPAEVMDKIGQRGFSYGKEIVLGYGGYVPEKGFLDKHIRYDTLFVAMNYLSAARLGIPYMGVGRNLAYKKDLFFNNKGFASHYGLKSGDDDLFINEVATRGNTTLLIDKGSTTRSIQSPSFRSWMYQKKRHLTTGKKYTFGTKVFLGLEPLSRTIYYFGAASCLYFFRETIYPYLPAEFAVFTLRIYERQGLFVIYRPVRP